MLSYSTAINFAVRRGKLRTYTLQTLLRYSGGLPLVEATRNVLWYVLSIWRGQIHSFKTWVQELKDYLRWVIYSYI